MPDVNLPLAISPELLYAFAQSHDGDQFKKSELRCRIVNAETDEGYRTQGLEVQFYGVPEDAAHYMKITGRDSADIVFHGMSYDGPIDDTATANVTALIRTELSILLTNKRAEFLYFTDLLRAAGLPT